ncbi:MAG: DNA primase large subunit PriL [Thermoplasmata archaeon]
MARRCTRVEPRRLAFYPFLRGAAALVREKGPGLSELLSDIAYAEARHMGVERLRMALETGELPAPSCRTEPECLRELLAYVCARLIVSVAASPHLIRRYALAEARRASRLMEAGSVEELLELSQELGLPTRLADGGILVHFTHFIAYSAGLRAPDWKLVNRDIVRGEVRVSASELCRLLEELLRRRFENELPLEVPEEVRQAFGEQARALKMEAEARLRRYQPTELGKIRVTSFPPCMRHLLAMAQSGENVPHSGRFSLVAFLNAVGASPEDMMKAFAGSPDFKEEKTRYQVEHITGISSGTVYTPPSCDTMKTYSLCIEPDELCAKEWMTHPLKYYRVKTGRGRRGAGAKGTPGGGQRGTHDADGSGGVGARGGEESGGSKVWGRREGEGDDGVRG